MTDKNPEFTETGTNSSSETIAQKEISAKAVKLSDAQLAKIERNRQRALLIRQARLIPHPYAKIETDKVHQNIVQVNGSKYIDTGGGFLLEQEDPHAPKKPLKIAEEPAPILKPDQPICLECQEEFGDSYLFRSFDYKVCDKCKDDEEKHALITRTDAKNVYLLKDCDLDKREPILKFLLRKNPHNVNWGEMKLYLQVQIEERASEVWGSEENLLEEQERREEKKEKSKVKKYNKQMKALRMSVRSSLYDRTSAASHQHTFGTETYNEEEDNYSHSCKECGYSEMFEKM